MPGVSELARASAEVQSAAPRAAYAAPLESAVRLLVQGKPLPRSLIKALLDEGHCITGLIRSVRPASV